MFDFLPESFARTLRSPASRRFVALAVIATVGLVVWGIVRWAANPTYANLFVEPLGIGEAQEYAALLTEENVPHRIVDNGANIAVPVSQVPRLKVHFAAREQGLSGCGAPAAFGLGSGALEQQMERARGIREQLNCTISRMDGVRQAQVNVTLQENSPFVNLRRAAKASVTVWPARGGRITDEMVESIAFIVASAVDGLEPGSVAVINGDGGYSLQAPSEGSGGGVQSNRELAVQRGIESELREKAERLLAPLMSTGEFQVQVSAKLDWTEIQRRSERFDPEAQAIVREENAEVPPGAAGPGSPSYTTEQRESQYSVTVENVTVSPGSIERLGVAVMVNENAQIFGDAADPQRPQIQLQQLARIDSVVRAAVGYDQTRGDVVTVTAIPFQVVQDTAVVAAGGSIESPMFWADMLIRPVLGLLAILLVAFFAFKLLKAPALSTPPLPARSEPAGSLPTSETQNLGAPVSGAQPALAGAGAPQGATSGSVGDDPAEAARVVKAWLQEV